MLETLSSRYCPIGVLPQSLSLRRLLNPFNKVYHHPHSEYKNTRIDRAINQDVAAYLTVTNALQPPRPPPFLWSMRHCVKTIFYYEPRMG